MRKRQPPKGPTCDFDHKGTSSPVGTSNIILQRGVPPEACTSVGVVTITWPKPEQPRAAKIEQTT